MGKIRQKTSVRDFCPRLLVNPSSFDLLKDQVRSASANSSPAMNLALDQERGVDRERENIVFATLHNTDIKVSEFMCFFSFVTSDLLAQYGITPNDEMVGTYMEMDIDEGLTMRENATELTLDELKRSKTMRLNDYLNGIMVDPDYELIIDEEVISLFG